MEHTIIPGEPETAATDATPAVAANTAEGGTGIVVATNGNGQEKRSQVITWFLGLAMLWLVISYSAIGLISAYAPPQQGAYDIVTAMQAGIKDLVLMVLGGFLGAITQKHA